MIKKRRKIKKFTDDISEIKDFYGIRYFLLWYYNIPIVFSTNVEFYKDETCVYEIKLKKKKVDGHNCYVVCDKITHTKNPLVVPQENNTFWKTNFFVKVRKDSEGKFEILVPITEESPAYKIAKRQNNVRVREGLFVAEEITNEELFGQAWILPDIDLKYDETKEKISLSLLN